MLHTRCNLLSIWYIQYTTLYTRFRLPFGYRLLCRKTLLKHRLLCSYQNFGVLQCMHIVYALWFINIVHVKSVYAYPNEQLQRSSRMSE